MSEISGGPPGGFIKAMCQYCGWASQSRDLEDSLELNAEHEKTHPEWTPPDPLEDLRKAAWYVNREIERLSGGS